MDPCRLARSPCRPRRPGCAPPPLVTGPGRSPRLRSVNVIRFADCELNLDRIVLRRGGKEIRVEPQVFDVLAYLVKHRGAVVRKEELLNAVRQAVGDDGSRQLIIRTVHGKGYEFVATVEEIQEGRTGVAMSPVAAG